MSAPSTPRTALPRGFSVYLDLLRFGAALMVLLYHVKKFEMGPAGMLRIIPDRGHDFVILFFVLSGYVIASAADRKRGGGGLREFALDRMARVYSVAVPVLVFCTVIALLLHEQIDPERHWANGSDHPYLTFGLNIVFMGQSWWLHMMPFLNEPYWSLCYEVVYYAGFGAFMFMRGWPRVVAILAVAALAGPKILLLLPCWLFGAAAYFWRDRWQPRRAAAIAAAFVVPVVILLLLHLIHFAPTMRAITKGWFLNSYEALDFSNDFLVDYTAAALAAFHLYAVRNIGFRWPASLRSFITAGAAMSFTLYLFHMPLVFLVMYGFGDQHSGLRAFAACVFGIPLVCYAVSRVTESQRGVVRGWLDRLLPGAPKQAPA